MIELSEMSYEDAVKCVFLRSDGVKIKMSEQSMDIIVSYFFDEIINCRFTKLRMCCRALLKHWELEQKRNDLKCLKD